MRVKQMRLVVETDRLDEAATFYRDVMGLPEQFDIESPQGARVVCLQAGYATLELINSAQRRLIDNIEVGEDVSPRIRVAFEVEDINDATARVGAAEAHILAGPVTTPWNSRNTRLNAPGELQLTLFEEGS